MENRNGYTPRAVTEFLESDEADAFIIAYALQNPDEYFIVSQEKSDLTKKSRIKIPDCCTDFSIRCMNTIEMFRFLGERF